MERSITQATSGDGRPAEEALEEESLEGTGSAWASLIWGLTIILLCLAVYVLIRPNRENFYVHFVWQAQAWLDGQTSIPTGVRPTDQSPGNYWYHDVQPILDENGEPTGRGIIPFPPLPALVLLPFVAVWHLSTSEQLLAAVFSAVDVGIAYWMLGYLPVEPAIRRLTALFFGLGTALLYTAAIGTTWFWAHVVALACLLLAVGLALSADRAAARPPPARKTAPPEPIWPGGWRSITALLALGLLAGSLFPLAGAGASAAVVAGVGLLAAFAAAVLAVAVSGRRGTLLPYVLVAVIGGGIPAAFLLGTWAPHALRLVNLALGAAGLVLAAAAWRQSETLDRLIVATERIASLPETRQVAAGLMFGLACGSRLTILFGFPFLLLVGGGGNWRRRGLLAGAGAAVPLLGLLVYTYASTGHLFNPAYEYLYRLELGYPFNYHADWAIEDLRYVPQNLGILLFGTPLITPAALPMSSAPLCAAGQARGVFDVSCPLMMPDPMGMSVILTSPAYLLAPLAFVKARAHGLDRLTVGAAIAVVFIAFVNLMHFSQGWVQFGYRFSNDFAPFALILVALGASRLRARWLLAFLTGLSVAVCLWGTIWGINLGW